MTTTTSEAAGATAVALGPVVDVLVVEPVGELCVAELQARIGAVGLQVDRLAGWLSGASGELQARTGGVLRTQDGGLRTVVSWLAEQQRESPSAVGSALKTSVALRSLPLVVEAVLDRVLTPGQAAVLARLVGRISQPALTEAEPSLVRLAAGLNPAELAAQRLRHPHAKGGPSRPATWAARPAAAPDHQRCATPTTYAAAPTAAPPPRTTWSCSAADTTSCGTSANSTWATCTSPGTPTPPPPDHPADDAPHGGTRLTVATSRRSALPAAKAHSPQVIAGVSLAPCRARCLNCQTTPAAAGRIST